MNAVAPRVALLAEAGRDGGGNAGAAEDGGQADGGAGVDRTGGARAGDGARIW